MATVVPAEPGARRRQSAGDESTDCSPDDAAARWSVVEYRGRQALELLEADWRRLYLAMPLRTAFHAYEAHAAYLDDLMAAPERLRCLVLSDGLGARLICPLEARTDRLLGLPIRIWGVPWHPHWPLADVVCPEDEARQAFLPALVAFLRSRPEGRPLVVLGPLPGSSVLWNGLRRLEPREYCAHTAMDHFVIDCEKPFDELMSRLSRHFRKELRRCGRRLASLEDVRFETACSDADLELLFEDFLAVEGSGWKGESGTGSAIRLHPRYASFYRSLARELGDGDGCEINALYAEGRCIAGELSMRTGQQYATLKIGYDERYARLSPGQLLCARTLERCCADPQISHFDQLSDAAWLHVWHADSVPLQQVHIAIGRWSGPVLVALLQLRFGYGRRAVRWIRRTVRRHTQQAPRVLAGRWLAWSAERAGRIAAGRKRGA